MLVAGGLLRCVCPRGHLWPLIGEEVDEVVVVLVGLARKAEGSGADWSGDKVKRPITAESRAQD